MYLLSWQAVLTPQEAVSRSPGGTHERLAARPLGKPLPKVLLAVRMLPQKSGYAWCQSPSPPLPLLQKQKKFSETAPRATAGIAA